MSGGLIRGGSGEIPLSDVLLQHRHLAVAMRRDTERIARAYEAQHPGVVVVCDWEIIDDIDIAAMPETARQRALADRAALEARRAAAKEVKTPEPPKRAGDSARFQDELRRLRIDMRNLEIHHPQYVPLFIDLSRQINALEDALIADGVNERRTTFTIATQRFRKPKPMSDARKEELAKKVEAYKALSIATRAASIEAAVDPDLTRMLLEVETDQPIRDRIVLKLFTMEQTAMV